MPLRLVVGLGNPGSRYAKTRHNIGFRLMESLAGDSGAWKDFHGQGLYTRRNELILAQPLTFMNESGRFVESLSRFFKILPADMLVCFDDVALALGRLRLKASGSSGGQKGMQSIIEHLATQGIPRLRIGIGPQPAGRDSADFVLERFSAAEEKLLPEVLEAASAAVATLADEGLEAAMNRFNPAPKAL